MDEDNYPEDTDMELDDDADLEDMMLQQALAASMQEAGNFAPHETHHMVHQPAAGPSAPPAFPNHQGAGSSSSAIPPPASTAAAATLAQQLMAAMAAAAAAPNQAPSGAGATSLQPPPQQPPSAPLTALDWANVFAQPPPAVPAPAPAPAPAAAPAPAPAPPLTAANLAALLAGAIGPPQPGAAPGNPPVAVAGGGGGAYGGFAAQQQQQQQQQQRPRHRPRHGRSSGAAAAAVAVDSVPQWVTQARQWLGRRSTVGASSESGGIFVPESDEAAVAEAISKALGQPTALLVPGTVRPLSAALGLNLTGQRTIEDSALTALVTARTQRRFLVSGSLLQTLADSHARVIAALSSSASAAPGAGAAVLRRLQHRLEARAAAALGEETDDLFSDQDGGRNAEEFLLRLADGRIGVAFLQALVTGQCSRDAEVAIWEDVLRGAFGGFKAARFTDAAAINARLYVLDVLLQQPQLQKLLLGMLLREVEGAGNRPDMTGQQFESASLLAPLLAVSPYPEPNKLLRAPLVFESPARDYFTALRGYPERRGEAEAAAGGLRAAMANCRTAALEICMRLVKMKGTQPGTLGRDVLLAWLAAAGNCLTARAAAGEGIGALRSAALRTGGSDGFALGLAALSLRLCRPFLGGAEKHLRFLDAGYYTSQRFRLPGVQAEPSLAGRLPADPAPRSTARNYFAPDREASDAPHFVAECFFLTQRALHVGLLPAVTRYQQLAEQLARAERGGAGNGAEEGPRRILEAYLLDDCCLAHLLDPDFAADAVQFMALQGKWLVGLAGMAEQEARAAFAAIPQSVVRDLAAWLVFVIRAGQAQLLGGIHIAGLVECLVRLLQRSDLAASPLVQSRAVELLLAMLAPQLDSRRRAYGGMLAPTLLRPGEAALIAAVLGTGATQRDLVPALMRVYAAADNVEGLDVDRDAFDKFTLRSWIDLIFLELWRDENCKKALTELAGQPEHRGTFADYVAAALNSLMYLLKDSLERLQDIRAIEQAKADAAGWQALNPRERQDKEAFYEGQGRTGAAFMRMARTNLQLLNQLSSASAVRASFLVPPSLGRAAYSLPHFLELLLGPRNAGLKVENPEKYHFDTRKLLLLVCEVLLRLAESPAFVAAVAEQPDYEEAVLRKAHSTLVGRQLGEYEHAARLEKLINQVAAHRGGGEAGAAAESSNAAAVSPANGSAGAEIPDLSFAEPPPEDLDAAYKAELEPLDVADFDSTLEGAYNRDFGRKAEAAAGDDPGKVRRLTREFRALQGSQRLPINPAAAIFVRHDSDRMDKVRALITGPEGTPYAYGCFVFDVFFPPDYPNNPPLVNLETTGGGTARFNPNLYADGKVCLSLLGTWHGSDASEKWNPQSSSLWQVLMSIQAMILIADPYYNEPQVELMRGKAEGIAAAAAYNADLHLHTIRLAMIDMLKRPRPGFEAAIRAHFRMTRHAVMAQCQKWLDAASGMDALYRRRLSAAVSELHGLLAAL